jgi:hypothetical protein
VESCNGGKKHHGPRFVKFKLKVFGQKLAHLIRFPMDKGCFVLSENAAEKVSEYSRSRRPVPWMKAALARLDQRLPPLPWKRTRVPAQSP